MKFLNVLVLSAVSALAAPAELEQRQGYDACNGLMDTPKCCGTDILGIISLDCDSPPSVFTTPAGFTATCTSIGSKPRCCAIGLDGLGAGLLCNKPLGINI